MTIEDFFKNKIKTGRIEEISNTATAYYEVKKPNDLSAQQKLKALCVAANITPSLLDKIISTNIPVLRTVKGHAFEIVFNKIMNINDILCEDIGGDGDVDLIVNGRTLQCKTPYINGCNETTVSYKTHKTHGAKSELESLDYYHQVTNFADYLVGLVSYEPFQVLIIPKKDLPRVSNSNSHIASPMFMPIKGPYLNAFDKIGITKELSIPPSIVTPSSDELLPISANVMKLRSEYILEAIFRIENFRIWDMNIRGFIREAILNQMLAKNQIKVYHPMRLGLNRADKTDFVLKSKANKYVRFQVKGLTYNSCTLKGTNSIIDCETQLSRGRVNNHPTQSRLYMTSDFEYVIIAIDPPYSNQFSHECYNKDDYEWHFYCIPTTELRKHPTFSERVFSHQRIDYIKLQKYMIDEQWMDQWSKI